MKVFISHSQKDIEFVNKLKEELDAHDIGVIIDAESAKFGDNLQTFLEQSVSETDFTISIISKHSLQSVWVIAESLETLMYEKVEGKKRFLPIYIDTSFLDDAFYLRIVERIDESITTLQELTNRAIENHLATSHYDQKRKRLVTLRNNLDTILEKLTTLLVTDFSSDEKFSKNLPELIEVIKSAEKKRDEIPISSTKKILILSANPKDTARLRLDEEVREIEEGLRRSKHRDQFAIQSKWAVRLRDLRRSLLDEEPQIVHFCGHGEEDGLMVEDDNGNAILVDPDALAGLFELFKNQIECVFLNACYSEYQADAINKHINFVIGMTKGINDKAAIEFAVGFYDALGAGKSVNEAFKFGRNAIQLYSIPQHLIPVLKIKTDHIGQQIKVQTLTKSNELDKESFRKQRENIEGTDILKKIKSRGYWEIIIHPQQFSKERIQDIIECKKIIQNKQIRGDNPYSYSRWPFPFYDRQNGPVLMIDHVEQSTVRARRTEYWRYYQSGQFVFLRGLSEDWTEENGIFSDNSLRIPPLTSLSIFNAVGLFTDVFRFASGLASQDVVDTLYTIQIILHGAKDRKLTFCDPDRDLDIDYCICKIEEILYEKDIPIIQLQSSPDDMALNGVVWLFQRFNWDNVKKETVKTIQKGFLEERT